jgi:aminoglycoside phosphotransferase
MHAAKLRPSPQPAPSDKAVRPKSTTYLLKGHSGASVELHVEGIHSFVRKTSANASTGARLKAQAGKQRSLWMMGMPFPRVLREAEDRDGRAVFDMAYIPGRTLADAVIQAAPFDAARIAKAVERLLGLFLLSKGGALPAQFFTDKISEISSRPARNGWKISSLMDACRHRLAACDWHGIPASPCHGDLSLENILLTAGKSVAFIDCDDPWVSSFWLDFGKLFQDIDGHWCLRSLYLGPKADVRLANAVQKLDLLGAILRPLARSLDSGLPNRLPQLAALNLYRAIPYATDPTLVPFLCRRILKLLERVP